LRTLARLAQTHFLALDRACVAGQEARPAQRAAKALVMLHERTGDAVADGTGLAGVAAADDGDADVYPTGHIGYFQRLPEGRAFLMQVPGLLNAGLPDDRRAAVTTWLVRTFAGPSLSPDFQPYTAAEARQYRESRPADIAGTRKRLYEELLAAGYAIK